MARVYWLSKARGDFMYVLVQFIPSLHFRTLLKRRDLFVSAQKVTFGLSLKRMVYACNSLAFYGIHSMPRGLSEHSGLLFSDVDMRGAGLLITESEADQLMSEVVYETISGRREMSVSYQGIRIRYDFGDELGYGPGQVTDTLFFTDIEEWIKAKRKKVV